MPARLLDLPVTSVLGLVSVVIAVWFALPQLLRLRRTGSAAGVSLESLVNSCISLVGWTAYGVAHANGWVVVASVVGIPAVVATLVLAVRQGHRLTWRLPLIWATLLTLVAVVDRMLGTALIDLALGCSILWFVIPAALTAWRATDVSGLAPQTWFLLAAEGVIFGAYGWLAGVGADRVYGVAALLGSAAVLARIAVLRFAVLRFADRLPQPREVWQNHGVPSTTIIID